jgi:hypothetical protein
MKVCPPQEVVPKLVPVVVPAVFDWSMLGAFDKVTSPGLAARSQFVTGLAVWKSACVVSVKQPLAADAVSAKSFVVVPPSVTTLVVFVTDE